MEYLQVIFNSYRIDVDSTGIRWLAGFRGPHDIGLILFHTPFVFNDFVSSITLALPDTIPTGVATIHGWGSTASGFVPNFPDILQTADLVLVPLESCRNDWPWADGAIGETHVCAGQTASACMLDDGGALVQGDVAVALLSSWGNFPCGSMNRPAIFTRISAYISWIDNVTNNALAK